MMQHRVLSGILLSCKELTYLWPPPVSSTLRTPKNKKYIACGARTSSSKSCNICVTTLLTDFTYSPTLNLTTHTNVRYIFRGYLTTPHPMTHVNRGWGGYIPSLYLSSFNLRLTHMWQHAQTLLHQRLLYLTSHDLYECTVGYILCRYLATLYHTTFTNLVLDDRVTLMFRSS